MGAAYCAGRKEDELFLQQTLASWALGKDGAPPPPMQHYAVGSQQRPPVWSTEHERDRSESTKSFYSNFAEEDASQCEEQLSERLDLHIAALLASYGNEVHNGHGLLTAADSYYFALLESQRRHDSVGIQAEAVRQILNAANPDASSSWRQRLAEKRAEAAQALADRAQHYAVGRRSSRGLLQITSGARAESTLQGYEALLDKEYDLAATEIQAALTALLAEPEAERKDHAQSLLEQLSRGATFWASQIEETFEVWQTASVRLNQAQVKRNAAWGELLPAVRALLSELRESPRPQSDEDMAYAGARTQCCVRLLELDLHQYAHGLSSAPRRQLIIDLLSSAREDGGTPVVASALLHDASFCALKGLPIGGSGHCVLQVQSVAGHPWASELGEIFGELVCSLCKAEPESQALSLSEADDFLTEPSYREVREAAAAYARPRSGTTALHQATRAHNLPLVQRLLEHQANPLAREADGCSPLDIAENDGDCPAVLAETLRSFYTFNEAAT